MMSGLVLIEEYSTDNLRCFVLNFILGFFQVIICWIKDSPQRLGLDNVSKSLCWSPPILFNVFNDFFSFLKNSTVSLLQFKRLLRLTRVIYRNPLSEWSLSV